MRSLQVVEAFPLREFLVEVNVIGVCEKLIELLPGKLEKVSLSLWCNHPKRG